MDNAKILLATTNKGKIDELRLMLRNCDIEVLDLNNFPDLPEIPETGATFMENAIQKAAHAAAWSGLIAIADDSGLVVDALHGAPGIYSARFANDWDFLPDENRDQRNIRKLLHELRNVPREKRTAHFETAIAAVRPNGETLTALGQWPGRILEHPLGNGGFGYDPVFFDDSLNMSAAQMERSKKNMVSHRGRALKALLERLPEFIKGSV